MMMDKEGGSIVIGTFIFRAALTVRARAIYSVYWQRVFEIEGNIYGVYIWFRPTLHMSAGVHTAIPRID